MDFYITGKIIMRCCFARLIYLSIFVLIFISGCAPIPEHDMACMVQSLEIDQVVDDALTADEFQQGNWPKAAWWEDFNDPALTSLIEQALELSPTLQRAEARLKAAAQKALQKRSALFPEIDGNAQTNWQHYAKDSFFRAFAPQIPAVINEINLGLSFIYEFDFWGKNRDLFQAAQGLMRAELAERKQAELILTTSIAYGYMQLQFLLQKQTILQQMKVNEATIAMIHSKRQDHAIGSISPVLQAQTDTLDVQAMLVAAEQQVQEELHELKALAGLGQDAELEIAAVPLQKTEVAIPEKLSLDLIARRPDLLAQKERTESLAKEVGAAKTDFYPNINLSAFAGWDSIYSWTLFRSQNYSGFVEPAIHLPIFTAGRLKAQLMEKVALFNEAVFTYNGMILQIAKEVADSLTAISYLQRQIEVRELSVRSLEQEAGFVARRYEHAIESQLSMLSAQNNVLEMQLLQTALEYAKQQANIQLIRALGGGYCD